MTTIRHVAATAVSAAIAVSVASAPALAQERERTVTVILKCDYLGADGFSTRVAGVETAGPVSARLAAALGAEMSCAQAASLLADAGLELVHVSQSRPATGGAVSGSDLAVWTSNYGSSN